MKGSKKVKWFESSRIPNSNHLVTLFFIVYLTVYRPLLLFLSIFNLLGCALRPRNTFKDGFTYGK